MLAAAPRDLTHQRPRAALVLVALVLACHAAGALGAHALAGLGRQHDHVAVGGVPVDGERAGRLIEDPVVRHAGLVVTAQLDHGVDGAVGLAHDLAQPVGADRHRPCARRLGDAVAPPAGDVGAVAASFEHDVHLGAQPPAPETARSAGPPIERAAERARRAHL